MRCPKLSGMGKRAGTVIWGFVLITLTSVLLSAQVRIQSPDNKLYAIEERGRKIGKGEERERFLVFAPGGRQVSVLHIWLTEPDGTGRTEIRGCESFGWIDSNRFFCEGNINPSNGIYRWFNARSGRELGEADGTQFKWSPDRAVFAHFGNVPHFSDVADKTDSLDVGAHTWPVGPEAGSEQHWFRSDLSWSPDSKCVAVVDHQRRVRKAFFLEVVDAKSSKRTEYKLKWPDEADEWYPNHDFGIQWSTGIVTVRRGSTQQSFVH
jgi:hypothetical protein